MQPRIALGRRISHTMFEFTDGTIPAPENLYITACSISYGDSGYLPRKAEDKIHKTGAVISMVKIKIFFLCIVYP